MPNRDAGSKRKLSASFAQRSQNVHRFSTADFLVDSWKKLMTDYFNRILFPRNIYRRSAANIRRNAVVCAGAFWISVEAEIYAFDRLGAAARFIDFDLNRIHLYIAFGDGEFRGHLIQESL